MLRHWFGRAISPIQIHHNFSVSPSQNKKLNANICHAQLKLRTRCKSSTLQTPRASFFSLPFELDVWPTLFKFFTRNMEESSQSRRAATQAGVNWSFSTYTLRARERFENIQMLLNRHSSLLLFYLNKHNLVK